VFTGLWVVGVVFGVVFEAAAGAVLAAVVAVAVALEALASVGRAPLAGASELEGEPLHAHRAARSAEQRGMRIDMAWIGGGRGDGNGRGGTGSLFAGRTISDPGL